MPPALGHVVLLHRWLELAGKLATVVWVMFVASVVLGVNWKDVVEHAINSGRPVAGALTVAVVVPTLLFVAARSAIGFALWRLQRELWRRDVERMTESPELQGRTHPKNGVTHGG